MDGARPLSPHLSVYSWRITMWLSSLHRITGLLLSLGAVALAVWLLALAGGAESYATAQSVTGAGWFKLPLVLWTFCLFYHLANGVRHLAWDAVIGFEKSQIVASGRAVVVVSVTATVAFAWLAIF